MQKDFLDELGELALGTRLKRISERMLTDAAKVYEHFGITVQPKWFALLALLDKNSTVSVVEASEYLGLSQPALSQFCRQLVSAGLIEVSVGKSDSRKKVMQLSATGRIQVDLMKPIWQQKNCQKKMTINSTNRYCYLKKPIKINLFYIEHNSNLISSLVIKHKLQWSKSSSFHLNYLLISN
jgi:DNA-binding MarR family transcriptional regulator